MTKKHLYLMATSLFCASLYGLPQAKAGFEWRGMPDTAQTELPAPIGANEGPVVTAVPIAPVETVGGAVVANPVVMGGRAVSGADTAYNGFGRDIPLDLAVRQIIPDGYVPAFATSVDTRQPVSWTGDGQWNTTLDSLLNKVGLKFVETDGRIEILPQMTGTRTADITHVQSPVPVAITPQSASPTMAPMPAPRHVGAPVQVASAMQPVPLPTRDMGVDAIWTAGANDTLRETLSRWSLQNGSEMVWTIDYDYRLKEPISMGGSYVEAVQNLLDRFRKVEPRPYGELGRTSSGGQRLIIRAYGL